jgi:hypothetical protein
VDVEMPKRSADVPTIIYRSSQFPRGPPRFVSLIVDTSTVLGQELMSEDSSIQPR